MCVKMRDGEAGRYFQPETHEKQIDAFSTWKMHLRYPHREISSQSVDFTIMSYSPSPQ